MGLSLRKLFKAREKPGEDVQLVSSVEIADQQVRDAVTEICLRELAFWTCVGKIANALTKCEFRTFYEGEELFKDEYYLWNYEPNRNQNKAEFLSKAMEQLFRNNELLIVESYDGQLLVADDFSVTKNALYGDTYTNVQVDDYTFSRSFRSSDVLHWTLNNKNVNRIIQNLYDSYSKLIDYSAKSYLKSRGSRGTLNISAMAQSDKLEKLMNEYLSHSLKAQTLSCHCLRDIHTQTLAQRLTAREPAGISKASMMIFLISRPEDSPCRLHWPRETCRTQRKQWTRC